MAFDRAPAGGESTEPEPALMNPAGGEKVAESPFAGSAMLGASALKPKPLTAPSAMKPMKPPSARLGANAGIAKLPNANTSATASTRIQQTLQAQTNNLIAQGTMKSPLRKMKGIIT